MTLRTGRLVVLLAGGLAAGCAGFRGGWESIAYITDPPPVSAAGSRGAGGPAELRVPGLRLAVSLDNRLRTHDTQVYFFALPLSVDPRRVYADNVARGRTRVFVTVTPEDSGFVFRPGAAVLRVGERSLNGATGHEFDMWDESWRRVAGGGRWEHRPIGTELELAEVGRRYYLSIDFDTPSPSPESPDIVLDLSEALKSGARPPLPPIRFAPRRWRESYS